MNDSHVMALIYSIEHRDSVDYEEAGVFVREEQAFRLEVKDKKVRFELKEHYAEELDARKSIEEYIRMWEFGACLDNGPDSFKLRFDEAEIKDRNPTPGEVSLRVSFRAGIPKVSASVTRGLPNYPSPPSGLAINPDVQTMYDRYMNYHRGHESLLSMAYFCLTLLEDTAKRHYTGGQNIGKRVAASRYYQIEKKILEEIGNLTSNKGGRSEARKNQGIDQDLTSKERLFLNQVIREIVRRAAEKTYNPTVELRKISLSDLQNL